MSRSSGRCSIIIDPPEQGVVLNYGGVAKNSLFAEIKPLQSDKNFETSYVSLARVFDAQL